MTSDSQRAGQEPDETAPGAEWAPFGGETPPAPPARGEGPPDFAWAPPAPTSWSTPGNSWTVAYTDPGSEPAGGPRRGFPTDWASPDQTRSPSRYTEQQQVPPASPWEGRASAQASEEPDERRRWGQDLPRPNPPAPPGGPLRSTSDASQNPLPHRGGSGQHAQPDAGPGQPDFPRFGPSGNVGRAAVPPVALPPQQTRIPGASLAADPPVPYDRPTARSQHEPPARGEREEWYAFADRPPGNEREADDQRAAQHGADQPPAFPGGPGRVRTATPATPHPSWNPPPSYAPGSTGEASDSVEPIPQPRDAGQSTVPHRVSPPRPTAQDDGEARGHAPVTASAAVPAASRVSPPDDHGDPGRVSPPQPRVYGRPAAAEPDDQRPNRQRTDDWFAAAPPVEGRARPAGGWPEPHGRREVPTGRAAASTSDQAARVPYAPPPGPDDDRQNTGRFAPSGPPTGVAPRLPGGPATGTARPVNPVPGAPPAAGRADTARVTGPADAARATGPADAGWATGPAAAAGIDEPARPQPPRWGEQAPAQWGPWSGGATADARPSGWADSAADAGATERGAASGSTHLGPGPWTEGAPARSELAMPWPSRDDGQPERYQAPRPAAADPAAELPAPQVRNVRVLLLVLAAAVLLLTVPLGTLWLLGRTGDPPFNPAVGSCVKQQGGGAVAAACGDAGAYTVVSKVNDPATCADPKQPHVVLPDVEGDNVLCLRPAAGG